MQYLALAGGDLLMKRLLLVGGDKRAVYLADLLRREGYSVQTLGLSDDETVTWEAVDCALFPYPFSVKKVFNSL